MDSRLLWTKKYPRSVTFFNSVIKSPLLWTLLMDSRLLWTLFLVPIEEKTSIVDKKYPISEKKHNFLTKLSDCSVMRCEANCRKNTTTLGVLIMFF